MRSRSGGRLSRRPAARCEDSDGDEESDEEEVGEDDDEGEDEDDEEEAGEAEDEDEDSDDADGVADTAELPVVIPVALAGRASSAVNEGCGRTITNGRRAVLRSPSRSRRRG